MRAVDLDELEGDGRIAAKFLGMARMVRMDPEDVLALVAELRAAREVVKAARWIERTGALPPSNEVGARRLSDLEQAVRAYEEAVQP